MTDQDNILSVLRTKWTPRYAQMSTIGQRENQENAPNIQNRKTIPYYPPPTRAKHRRDAQK